MSNRSKETLAAFLFYTTLALAFFWPCLRYFSSALIGPPEDNMQFYWFLWYGTESLLGKHLPFLHTTMIYYPEGASLLYANYYYFGIFVTVILRCFMSLAAAFNLLVLGSFVLSALFAYWLLRYLTGNFWVSLAGGFCFGFNPSHVAHALHHITIASIQFIPLFFLFFLRLIREPFSWRRLVLSAFFLSLSALCDWNYLVYGFVFIVLSYGYLAFRRRSWWLSGVAAKMAAVIALCAMALGWLLVPMIWAGLHSTFKRDLPGHDIYVADLLAFFVPSVYHRLAGWNWIGFVNGQLTGTDWEKPVYLGWINLAILAAAMRNNFRALGKYWIGLLAFMVLAMGVRLHVLGKGLPVILPYKLIEMLPFFTNARNPSRIIVFAYLFLSILVAFSLKALFADRIKRGWMAKTVFAVIFLLMIADFFSQANETTPVILPPAYDVIRQDPDHNFAILEIPWDGPRTMMYQSILRIPNVQGYLGRRIETTLGDRLSYNLGDLEPQKKMLKENRVKYIVLHKKRLDWDPRQVKDRMYTRALEMVSKAYGRIYPNCYEDDKAAVFRVYD